MEEERKEEFREDPFNIDLSTLDIAGAELVAEELLSPEPEETEEKEELINEDENELKEEEESSEELEDKESPASQDIDEETSPFIPFAKLLVEAGATPNLKLEDFKGDPEGLVKAIQDEIQYGIGNYKEALHPKVKWLQDNLDEGVPFKELLEIDQQRVTLDKIKEETLESDESAQKEIVRQYYKESSSFSDAAIEKAIERLEATGDLADESKTFFSELKEINVRKEAMLQEQARQQAALQQKQEQEALENLKTTLESKEEIIPGIKVTPILRDKVYKTLTTIVDVQEGIPLNEITKARAENPLEFELNLAYIFNLTKGFKDWSAINSGGKKSAISEFESAVRKSDFSTSKQTTRKVNPDKGLMDSIDIITRNSRNY